ncbi:MAG: hypothetical protein IPK00_08505 [Deltaproteobacteria bacterium]|nr:hypothetical protein [Deltaproteobacteria bacterium]
MFVRDPEHYELGAGLQYAYQEISNDELHGLRGTLQGKLFLADRGAWWPALDLDLSGSFGAADVEDSGDDERLVHAVAGGLRIYPADRVALRLGGRYEHLEIQDGWRVETSVARVDLSVLILRTPALTLGPRFEGGDVRTEFVLFPHFQRSFYSAGVYVSLSFPGAESLVVLNRNYY